MISGVVSSDGTPTIEVMVADSRWTAVIDTGFNGDLELPVQLKPQLKVRPAGQVMSFLAGGQTISEDSFAVEFPFDGQLVEAEASFVESEEILLGTRLLREYRLTVDFPQWTVTLEHKGKN